MEKLPGQWGQWQHMLQGEHTLAKSPPWRKYQLHQLLLQHEQQNTNYKIIEINIISNIYGTLFPEENILMNNFISITWQKGSRQSSCSPTRRANPRPPQTRPLHTVSTRSTFTSSYNQNVYSYKPQLEKKLMVTLRPWTLVRLTSPPGPGQVAKAEQAAAISSTNHFSFEVNVIRKHQDKSMPCNINFWRWSEVRRGVLVVCTWWLSRSSAQTGFMVGQVFPVAPTDQPTRPTPPVRKPADFGNWPYITSGNKDLKSAA